MKGKASKRRPRRYDFLLHSLATGIVRAVVRMRHGRARPPERARGKVSILLMHAWGMGGTIRTTLNLAGYLSWRYNVEILSVVRRRENPFFSFPEGVTVTAIDDQRDGDLAWPLRLLRRVLRRFPSRLSYPGDRAWRACTLWSDVMILRSMWHRRSGVITGTRPALNMLALLYRQPHTAVVGLEHMNYSAHPPRLRTEIRKRYPQLDALVVLTEEDRHEYRRVLNGTTRITRIPNALPSDNGPVSELTEPVIVAAGRLTPQKGFDRLIPAFVPVARRHPDWTLRIYGRGPKRDALERLIAKHGLWRNVTMMPPVPNVRDEMAAASMLVLPSRFEGLPMVLLEAMSTGLPVVSFDCPTGPREVIEDGKDGVLVPDGDQGALAGAIIKLIEDSEERRRFGKAAKAKAAAYSLTAIGPLWDTLLVTIWPF